MGIPTPETDGSLSASGTSTSGDGSVHFLADPWGRSDCEAKALWGGKALSLERLHSAGLRVPPAFTLSIAACRAYHENGRKWPASVWTEVQSALRRLESLVARRLGDAQAPLTVAVRSGAAESMPGLLATFLHCGLTESLVRRMDNEATWQQLVEFLDRFGPARLNQAGVDAQAAFPRESRSIRARCEHWLAELAASSAGPLPDDPAVVLRDAISLVWDSWDNRAVRQFRQQGLASSAAGTAVTIQAMFASELSGVVFSQDPTGIDRDEMAVELTHGLGQSLVGGQVTPVRWTVARGTMSVRERTPTQYPADQALFDEFEERQLTAVCQAALRMESSFGAPVDMEFGYASGATVFFQIRPAVGAGEENRRRILLAVQNQVRELARGGQRLWVRHNLSDTLACPTPLTWDLWRTFMTGRGGFGRLHRLLGYRPSARVCRDGFLQQIGGVIYADPDRLVEVYCAGYPFRFDTRSPSRAAVTLQSPPTELDLERLDPWFLVRWPLIVWTIMRSRRRQRRMRTRAVDQFQQVVVPRIAEWVDRERRIELGTMDLQDLIATFRRRRQEVFDELAPQTMLPGALGAASWGALEQQLTEILGVTDARRMGQQLLSVIAHPVHEGQHVGLDQLSEWNSQRDKLLEEFGHRGPNELELSAPRWREIPECVEDWARRRPLLPPSPAEHPSKSAVRDQLNDVLARAGASCLAQELTATWQGAEKLLPYREIGKNEFLKAYEFLCKVVAEIGKRIGLGPGVCFLSLDELESLGTDRSNWGPEVAERRQFWRECRRLHMPPMIDADERLERLGLTPDSSSSPPARVLDATPLSGGSGTGRVVLMAENERIPIVEPGSVLVAPRIDPGWLPFMADAAAIAVERGGSLSHVAILARQFAIPAVAHDQITRLVADGQTVLVDADRGRIELWEKPT